MLSPFSLQKHWFGMNVGHQLVQLGAGGPTGYNPGPAAGARPWPPQSGVIRSMVGVGFGIANSAAAPRPFPYATTFPTPFAPGLQKQQTYGTIVF